MTRDEVLELLDLFGDDARRASDRCSDLFLKSGIDRRYRMFRAAAEIVRESGWRPIAEAPEWQSLIVGVWGERVGADGAFVSHEWFVEAFQMKKHEAIREGYTHYLAEPAPPAREASE